MNILSHCPSILVGIVLFFMAPPSWGWTSWGGLQGPSMLSLLWDPSEIYFRVVHELSRQPKRGFVKKKKKKKKVLVNFTMAYFKVQNI